MRKNFVQSFLLVSICSGIYFSCSKGGDSGGSNPSPNPCAGVTVAVTATVSGASSGANGSIVATATGGTGFTFKIGSGTYQSSGTFNNLAAGTYTITAKNSNGCEGSASFTVAAISSCTGTAGPLFTAVKQVIQNNCSGCHSGATPAAGRDWSVDCNIVDNKASIKARAVDQAGTASQMPQPPNAALSVADRQKITDWINAGGRLTD